MYPPLSILLIQCYQLKKTSVLTIYLKCLNLNRLYLIVSVLAFKTPFSCSCIFESSSFCKYSSVIPLEYSTTSSHLRSPPFVCWQSVEYSTLKELAYSTENMRICVDSQLSVIGCFWTSELPAPNERGEFVNQRLIDQVGSWGHVRVHTTLDIYITSLKCWRFFWNNRIFKS